MSCVLLRGMQSLYAAPPSSCSLSTQPPHHRLTFMTMFALFFVRTYDDSIRAKPVQCAHVRTHAHTYTHENQRWSRSIYMFTAAHMGRVPRARPVMEQSCRWQPACIMITLKPFIKILRPKHQQSTSKKARESRNAAK